MEITNKPKRYQSSDHLTFSCQYHVIFCPKYRRKILVGEIETRIKEIFEEVARQYQFSILDMDVMPDHVHLLIDCNPRFGIMDCVTKLKNTSARLLKEEFPELKSKLPNMWTRSAFISTVGSVSLGEMKQYIEDQKKV